MLNKKYIYFCKQSSGKEQIAERKFKYFFFGDINRNIYVYLNSLKFDFYYNEFIKLQSILVIIWLRTLRCVNWRNYEPTFRSKNININLFWNEAERKIRWNQNTNHSIFSKKHKLEHIMNFCSWLKTISK